MPTISVHVNVEDVLEEASPRELAGALKTLAPDELAEIMAKVGPVAQEGADLALRLIFEHQKLGVDIHQQLSEFAWKYYGINC